MAGTYYRGERGKNQLSADDLGRELETAIRLARQAGRTIMGYYRTGLAVEHKAGDEPLTAADLAADDLIRRGLRDAFPDSRGRLAQRRIPG